MPTHAALHFFNNGGKRLYIVRVAKDAATAAVGVGDRQSTPALTMTVAASSAGAWGNSLEVVVANGTADAGDEFRLTVQQDGVAAETFDNLSMNPDALNFAELVVNASSRLVRVTVRGARRTTGGGSGRPSIASSSAHSPSVPPS